MADTVNLERMTRENFVDELDRCAKLVRVEYGLTQEEMARILGVSKKTVVEIEKARTSLGWTGAVALSSLFRDSQILAGIFDGEQRDLIHALVFDDCSLAGKRLKT